jgi:hypothetical protein
MQYKKLSKTLKEINSNTLLHLVINHLSSSKNHRVAESLLNEFDFELTDFRKLMDIKQDGVNSYYI